MGETGGDGQEPIPRRFGSHTLRPAGRASGLSQTVRSAAIDAPMVHVWLTVCDVPGQVGRGHQPGQVVLQDVPAKA